MTKGRAFFKVFGGKELELTPMSEQDFRLAFCTYHEGVWTIRPLTGYPNFYVPGTDLVWPLPIDGLEIIYEESDD